MAALSIFTGVATCSITLAAPAPAPAADEVGNVFKSLADKVGPALVTVKYIMKIEASGQMAEALGHMGDEGKETEITGVMIEPGGLVLVSNAALSGGAQMELMSMFGGGGFSVNPTELKIIAGDDTEGLKAKILARDTELDLAWIKIDDDKAKGKTFPAIDLHASASPTMGDRLFAVDRMAKFFDHALTVTEGRVGGATKKPRSLFIPSGMRGDLGMPMFAADGKIVGFGVLQVPSKEDVEGGNVDEMMSGGGFGVMILPADDVIKATVRTKDMAEKAEAAPAAAAPSADPKKPDADGAKPAAKH